MNGYDYEFDVIDSYTIRVTVFKEDKVVFDQEISSMDLSHAMGYAQGYIAARLTED